MNELQEKQEKGTTNVVLPLDEGILIGTCSRLTSEKGYIVTDTSTKFKILTSTVGVVVSGFMGRADNVWEHLINWVKGEVEPTVYRVASAAHQYMDIHRSKGRYNATFIFIGHDYADNHLVPYIFRVEDLAAPPDEVSKGVSFVMDCEKIIVAGSGGGWALTKLNSCWRENMNVEVAYHVIKSSLLESALKEKDTGGIFRFFFMSPRLRTLRASHVCDSYMEKFEEYHESNQRAIFILCCDIGNATHFSYTFRHYGKVEHNQCLFEVDRVSFHRIEFQNAQSVDSAIKDSKTGQSIEEPFCHFRTIQLIASDGFVGEVFISMASQLILGKVMEHWKYVEA
ncbi:uncharacterized protein LOC112164463 isoform X1 [Rosa chinensis]|uniref:uncharacterized protein LOC112164463 isoform X1 n=1 Tax=Rosa chinensis TaxID=74649 RepID=UPI001AD90AD1|nr:uncharacterized protein LOC112164463 isoform X1 [Rosa chinensis]